VTGLLLVALGAIRGARVIATASPAGHDRLWRLGAEHVLDYHDAGWVREARGIAGAAIALEAAMCGSGGRAVVLTL
jgi:NADPH:quinone reductase